MFRIGCNGGLGVWNGVSIYRASLQDICGVRGFRMGLQGLDFVLCLINV